MLSKRSIFAPWIPPGNVIKTSPDSIFHSVFCVFPRDFSLHFRSWLHTACLYRYFCSYMVTNCVCQFLSWDVSLFQCTVCSCDFSNLLCFCTFFRVFKLNSNTMYFPKLSYGWFCTFFSRFLHRCYERPMLLDHVLTFCGLSIFTSVSFTLPYSFCKKQISTSQGPL